MQELRNLSPRRVHFETRTLKFTFLFEAFVGNQRLVNAKKFPPKMLWKAYPLKAWQGIIFVRFEIDFICIWGWWEQGLNLVNLLLSQTRHHRVYFRLFTMLRVVFVTRIFRVSLQCLRLKLTLVEELPAQSRKSGPNHKPFHFRSSPSKKFTTVNTTWHKPPGPRRDQWSLAGQW